MGGQRILSDAQLDSMCTMRENGWSCARIARHFNQQGINIKAGSIAYQCLRLGADTVPERQSRFQLSRPYIRNGRAVIPFSEQDDRWLRELESEGLNYSEIAAVMGRRPNSIRGRLMTLARRDARSEAQL